MERVLRATETREKLGVMQKLASNDTRVNISFEDDGYAYMYCKYRGAVIATCVSQDAGDRAYDIECEEAKKMWEHKKKKPLNEKSTDAQKLVDKIIRLTTPVFVEECDNFSLLIGDFHNMFKCAGSSKPRISKRGEKLHVQFGDIKLGVKQLPIKEMTTIAKHQHTPEQYEFITEYAEAEKVGIVQPFSRPQQAGYDAFIFAGVLKDLFVKNNRDERFKISVTDSMVYRNINISTGEITEFLDTGVNGESVQTIKHDLTGLSRPFTLDSRYAHILHTLIFSIAKKQGSYVYPIFVDDSTLIFRFGDWCIQVPIGNELDEVPQLSINIADPNVLKFAVAYKHLKKSVDNIGFCKSDKNLYSGNITLTMYNDRVTLERASDRIKAKVTYARYEVIDGKPASNITEPITVSVNYDELKHMLAHKRAIHFVGCMLPQVGGKSRFVFHDGRGINSYSMWHQSMPKTTTEPSNTSIDTAETVPDDAIAS